MEPETRPTILIVEDETPLLKLIAGILERGGFRVLAASSAAQARRIEEEFQGHIHLLLTDVVMPEMTGPDLAAAIKERRPDVRIMLMSGYPDGALLVLNHGWHFMSKPFLPDALLGKVAEVLGSPAKEQAKDRFDRKRVFKQELGPA